MTTRQRATLPTQEKLEQAPQFRSRYATVYMNLLRTPCALFPTQSMNKNKRALLPRPELPHRPRASRPSRKWCFVRIPTRLKLGRTRTHPNRLATANPIMCLVAVAEVGVAVRVNAASMDGDEDAAPRPMTVRNEHRQLGRNEHLLLGDWDARHGSQHRPYCVLVSMRDLRSTQGTSWCTSTIYREVLRSSKIWSLSTTYRVLYLRGSWQAILPFPYGWT